MRKPPPRLCSVVRTETISPHMKRITVAAPTDNPFPEDQASAYIKLVIPVTNQEDVNVSQTDIRPTMRTFTIRNQRTETNEIDIDFVLHGDSGPASSWAMNAKSGDQINIAGPGPIKMIDTTADWFLLVGDMTAMPAISVNIERLPANARGHVIFEILEESDKQELAFPEDLQVHWLINPAPEEANSLLLDKIQSIDWLDGRPSIFIAGESTCVRALRDYVNSEKNIEKQDRYISGYWQRGLNEMEHKKVKTTDK
jgi:NADPH-dependent ferric siderophore reductase